MLLYNIIIIRVFFIRSFSLLIYIKMMCTDEHAVN